MVSENYGGVVMLSVSSLRKKVSDATGIPVKQLSKLSWDEFDRIVSPRWNLRRRRGGLVKGVCKPLYPEDVKKTRKKAEKILGSY